MAGGEGSLRSSQKEAGKKFREAVARRRGRTEKQSGLFGKAVEMIPVIHRT